MKRSLSCALCVTLALLSVSATKPVSTHGAMQLHKKVRPMWPSPLPAPPPVPAISSVIPAPPAVGIAWEKSPEPGVWYNAWQGGVSGHYTNETAGGPAASMTIPMFAGTIYVAVTAFNTNDLIDSDYSNEISYHFRNAPAPPLDVVWGWKWMTNTGNASNWSDASPYWIGGLVPWTNAPPEASKIYRIFVGRTNLDDQCYIQSTPAIGIPFTNASGPWIMPGHNRGHRLDYRRWTVPKQ